MAEKGKYISKTVSFGGQTVTLFSLDGATWSTRKDELLTIQDRHDNERVTLAHIKGEVPDGSQRAKARAQPPRLAHSSATLQKSIERGAKFKGIERPVPQTPAPSAASVKTTVAAKANVKQVKPVGKKPVSKATHKPAKKAPVAAKSIKGSAKAGKKKKAA